jgi:hypothetical protein
MKGAASTLYGDSSLRRPLQPTGSIPEVRLGLAVVRHAVEHGRLYFANHRTWPFTGSRNATSAIFRRTETPAGALGLPALALATTATTAAATAAAATSELLALFGLVDAQRTAVEHRAVHLGDGLGCFV